MYHRNLCKLCSALIFILICDISFAKQTTISADESPFLINKNLVVNKQDTLKIDSGVTVMAGKNAAIICNGTLLINGSAKRPVIFSSDISSQWLGVIVSGQNSSIIADQLIINSVNGKSALTIQNKANAVIVNTSIYNNYGKNGGAISADNSGNVRLIDCLINNNHAENGSGIFLKKSSAEIVNCNIVYNHAKKNGGAIFSEKSNFKIINSIIYNNSESKSGQQIFQDEKSYSEISYSCLQNGVDSISCSNHNLKIKVKVAELYTDDPQFKNHDDYGLGATFRKTGFMLNDNSPYIDRGNPVTNLMNLPKYDIDGNLRVILFNNIDLGPYESSKIINQSIDNLVKVNQHLAEIPVKSNAKISFEQAVFDFGEVMEGDTIRHDFNFSNTGTDTLIIHNIRPACGCTESDLSSKIIPPGDSGTITAVFFTKGFQGVTAKTIVVYSNDFPQKRIMLRGLIQVHN